MPLKRGWPKNNLKYFQNPLKYINLQNIRYFDKTTLEHYIVLIFCSSFNYLQYYEVINFQRIVKGYYLPYIKNTSVLLLGPLQGSDKDYSGGRSISTWIISLD